MSFNKFSGTDAVINKFFARLNQKPMWIVSTSGWRVLQIFQVLAFAPFAVVVVALPLVLWVLKTVQAMDVASVVYVMTAISFVCAIVAPWIVRWLAWILVRVFWSRSEPQPRAD